MSASKNAEAVRELLRTDDPANFIERLTDMWEVWITSELIDGCNASHRAEMLITYKALCEMLRNISKNE